MVLDGNISCGSDDVDKVTIVMGFRDTIALNCEEATGLVTDTDIVVTETLTDGVVDVLDSSVLLVDIVVEGRGRIELD